MEENKEALPSAPRGKENDIDLESDAEMSRVDPVAKLGNCGVILVLFETPSGFALFGYDGLKLFQPDAIKGFKAFKDNPDTGVDEDLALMIKECIKPDQKLAVGMPEYKTIIES
ncbi:hypothetical protein C2845_PM16G20630 [Panicum miliaceum]|uniref:Nucleolar protein 58/56 N-terminal domain-containing protein n=1 Tax=Panicum miliaceum TaxID=4540 RepID=A0A3L6PVH2_PANMI|nr:hypothetical protein C2845_PM16G20630 [Panicum miliaceum]